MIDYLIVGSGLAGLSFCEFALQNDKKVIVYENHSQPSSIVAGGLYNPVVLKRFSEVWKAKEQLKIAQDFYANLENKLEVVFDFDIPIYRRFHSVEEQNNWFYAADKPNLKSFLSVNLIPSDFIPNLNSPNGYGKVLHTGYVDVKFLLDCYRKFLETNNLICYDSFSYSDLNVTEEYIVYKKLKVKNIIFCEGFGMHTNPYFNDLPLDGTKGELLLIKAPELKLDVIINSSIFILPIGNDLYKVGATYEWKDKTNLTTEEGKNELVNKLNEIIKCKYTIIDHFAGVRPTVRDRKPLVGRHHIYKNLYLLNGLGTRGVMLAPYLSSKLFDLIENNIPLEKEIDIQRYYKKNK